MGPGAAGSGYTVPLDAIPEPIVCVSTGGQVVRANALAERLFGYPHGALAGLPADTLLPGAAAVLREGAAPAAGAEVAGRRRDGTTFPAAVSLAPPAAAGDSLTMAAVRDLTGQQDERARLARQLSRAQRLESLGQLAGGLAREFGNALTVISSYASFIRETAAQGGGEDRWRAVREDIGQLENAAHRAAVLARQVTAFAGRRPAAPQPLDLNEVIGAVGELLEHLAGENVKLVTSLGSGLGEVQADRSQLEQALVSLASNARDAMPAGGTLFIETAAAQLGDDAAAGYGVQPGTFARLKVRDTGKGIPPEVIGQVFEPFFTTKPDAAGLGLTAVRGIATGSGGHAEISSEPGNGTTVTVLLPSTGPAAAAAAGPPAETAASGGGTILIVEDEANMREVTRRIVSSGGYHTLTAANGEDAIEVAASYRGAIDLLLTDVIMPQMTGSEVADRIRTRYPGIKILFMSGYTRGFLDSREALAEGFHLIEKPFTGPALLAKLRELLGSPPG